MTTDDVVPRPESDGQEAGRAGVVVCVPVTADRRMAHGWGRARRLALVTVAAGRIVDWTEHEVRWDELHDVGTEGSHHARVVRFLREHRVEVVVAQHMGPPMTRTLGQLGIRCHLGADGDAEAAVLAVTG